VPTPTKCPESLPDHLAVPRDWMSPQELADWIGVPVKSVYVWNSTATGPRATRVGKHVRYSRQSVALWLAAQEFGQGVA
jgi:hypothetical protein